MLRYSQLEMKQFMQQRYTELQKEYPLVVDQARDTILSLLAECNPGLKSAFTGDGGAEPHEYSALHEAFYVITHFLEEERLGKTRPIGDLEKEVWFRKYLSLPPKVISNTHTSIQ